MLYLFAIVFPIFVIIIGMISLTSVIRFIVEINRDIRKPTTHTPPPA
jgi:hypothetical protein